MSFTLNPDGGLPRLIRYLPASEFPSVDTIAMLDANNNLLRVNRSLFDQLSKDEQGRVLTTRAAFLEVA